MLDTRMSGRDYRMKPIEISLKVHHLGLVILLLILLVWQIVDPIWPGIIVAGELSHSLEILICIDRSVNDDRFDLPYLIKFYP